MLLRLAREAVVARVHGVPPPDPRVEPPRLGEPQGAFVTLLLGGDLRGCIGTVEPITPLAETVVRCAAAAATEDPRFPALRPADVPFLAIEVTLLEPPFEVRERSQVILGRHGLMAVRGSRRGVLLPQVAAEHGFDLPTFIQETLKKAGLPPDALERGGATLLAFEGEVLAEDPRDATGPAPGSPPRSPGSPG
jgi:uncharacterized protein